MEISTQFELKDTERTGDLLCKSAAFEKSGVLSGNYILKYRNSLTSNEEGFMEIRMNYINSRLNNVILLYNSDGNQDKQQDSLTSFHFKQLFYMNDYFFYVLKRKNGPILFKFHENTRVRLIRMMYKSYDIFKEICDNENKIHIKLKKCKNKVINETINYYLYNTPLMNMICETLPYTNYSIHTTTEQTNEDEVMNNSYDKRFNTMLRMFIDRNDYFDARIKVLINEPTIYDDGTDLYSFDID